MSCEIKEIMSARSFFEMRFALPGYTFILMVFLILLPNLLTSLQSAPASDIGLISAFLAFFTLLEGSAIGFLVSQIYWFFFNLLLRENELIETWRFLQEQYNLADKDIHRKTTFLDYLFLSTKKIDLNAYTQRRWDLLHTLGSTFGALLLGSLIGFLFRSCWSRSDLLAWDTGTRLLWDTFVVLVFLVLFGVLVYSYNYVKGEHGRMVLLMVRNVWYSGAFLPEEAQKVFPKEYFQQEPEPSNENEGSV